LSIAALKQQCSYIKQIKKMKNILLKKMVVRVALFALLAVGVSLHANAQADPALDFAGVTPNPVMVGQTAVIKLKISNFANDFVTDIPAQSMEVTVSVGDGTLTKILGLGAGSDPAWTVFSNNASNGTIKLRNTNGAMVNWVDQYVYIQVQGTNAGLVTAISGNIAYIVFPSPINPITGNANNLPGNYTTVNDNAGGGQLTVSPAVLPLKLLSFTATKQAAKTNTALLSWTVAEQVNTSTFVVERCTDGINYTAIGSLSAAGNQVEKKTYSYTDGTAHDGVNYYRLKMVDIDGKFTYSPVKSVTFDQATANISVVPNITTGEFYVKGLAKQAVIQIADMSGKTLAKYSSISQSTVLDISSFAAGVYIVEVIQDGKLAGSYKVVKQ
jgi:hypothetical protein